MELPNNLQSVIVSSFWYGFLWQKPGRKYTRETIKVWSWQTKFLCWVGMRSENQEGHFWSMLSISFAPVPAGKVEGKKIMHWGKWCSFNFPKFPSWSMKKQMKKDSRKVVRVLLLGWNFLLSTASPYWGPKAINKVLNFNYWLLITSPYFFIDLILWSFGFCFCRVQ